MPSYRVYIIKYDQINFEMAISHVLQESQATDFERLFIWLVLHVDKVTAVQPNFFRTKMSIQILPGHILNYTPCIFGKNLR